MTDGLSSIGDGVLSQGAAVVLRFDRSEVVVWHGSAGDLDAVAMQHGRAMSWSTVEECLAHARLAGWSQAEDAEGTSPLTLDFEPVQAWLRGRA